MRNTRNVSIFAFILACSGEDPDSGSPTEPPTPTVAVELPSPSAVDPAFRPLATGTARSWRRVVVDAGHGGTDLGAQGRSGVLEKDLALAVSRELGSDLRSRGLEAVELRTDDSTLALHRRTELANACGAGIYVSIHVNSDPKGEARGLEVYSLDLASDAASQRVATRENLAGFMAGEAGPTAAPRLDDILTDLRLGARVEQGRALATAVHQDLLLTLTEYYGGDVISDHGRRSAPFWVLADSDMPAILIELGYLTHPDEERRLRTAGFQRLVASTLGKTIADFSARAERVDGD